RITGWDREDVLARACSSGAIDGIEDSFASGGQTDADLVYLAAPVGKITEFLRNSGSLLKPGSIVTDAASTKREVCRVAREHLPREVRSVGAHPTAVTPKSGLDFAGAALFMDGAYAIVPPPPPPATDSKQAVSVPAPTSPAAPAGRVGASRRIPSGSRPDG